MSRTPCYGELCAEAAGDGFSSPEHRAAYIRHLRWERERTEPEDLKQPEADEPAKPDSNFPHDNTY